MKTILVDAVNAFVSEEGIIFNEMYELLEQFDTPKIILTGAYDDMFKTYGLDNVPYPVFTLRHDPEKTNPEYFKQMLSYFDLKPEDVIYFEHNPEAVKSTESVGVKTHFYDTDKKDLDSLKIFLLQNA